MTSIEMKMTQKLNTVKEYKNIIRFLNNETMWQVLHVMMPDFKDEQYNIERRCYAVATVMGVVDGSLI